MDNYFHKPLINADKYRFRKNTYSPHLTNCTDLCKISRAFLYSVLISFLEEKLHMACNQRYPVVIKLTAKGAHRMRHENINRSLPEQGQILKGW
jgi:hypothetical protein